ncbi:hypothetical protein [Nocardia sp. SYP-A9097]|uniref:hypothetical protein n=1 Tax=Nocardia sp. SYP-A9097 TaxID=2663237 RepID=UPI001890E3D8|nr:hypothetical protein [Nocardia sp. SYP-A9097]
MPRTARTTRAVRDLVRHCHGGLDVGELQPQLPASVRRVMPVDAALFATADPETLLFTGAYAEEPLRTPRNRCVRRHRCSWTTSSAARTCLIGQLLHPPG